MKLLTVSLLKHLTLQLPLLTQFRNESGILPTIARRISPAAISLNSGRMKRRKKKTHETGYS